MLAKVKWKKSCFYVDLFKLKFTIHCLGILARIIKCCIFNAFADAVLIIM